MASDVLRTGPGFDLDPQDTLRDDNVSTKLAQQHATDLLNLQRGEYPLDIRFGIDWLGLLQQKRVDPDVVAEDIRKLLDGIPSISGLSLSGTKDGQVLTLSGTGQFQEIRATAEVLVGLSATKVGQNGAARFFWRIIQ